MWVWIRNSTVDTNRQKFAATIFKFAATNQARSCGVVLETIQTNALLAKICCHSTKSLHTTGTHGTSIHVPSRCLLVTVSSPTGLHWVLKKYTGFLSFQTETTFPFRRNKDYPLQRRFTLCTKAHFSICFVPWMVRLAFLGLAGIPICFFGNSMEIFFPGHQVEEIEYRKSANIYYRVRN